MRNWEFDANVLARAHGDGYYRSVDFNWNADVDRDIYVDVYVEFEGYDSAWQYLGDYGVYTIYDMEVDYKSYTVMVPRHAIWDLKIELYRWGNPPELVDDWVAYDIPMELASEDEPVPDLKIVSLEYPSEVVIDQDFPLNVNIQYSLSSSTEILIQVYEHAGPLLDSTSDTLSGSGSKTYPFTLTAPSTSNPNWQLNIHLFYWDGEWIQSDIESIHIVVEDITPQPPDLNVFDPEIDDLIVAVDGVVFPGTPGETITRIHWDWGDGDSEDHWFPVCHIYPSYGDYTITVTAYQSDGLASTQTKQITLVVTRRIEFSGYEWIVKSSSVPKGPGKNYFSDSEENVWVDDFGQLHLRITNRNGKWYCAEVYSERSFGHGKYIFRMASRVDLLDQNVVAGLFTYDYCAWEYYYREIDIEFSRWGLEYNNNTQYVVQPWYKSGNLKPFTMALSGDYSTHSFIWDNNVIFFQSLDPPYTMESWPYLGDDNPPPGNEKVHINLWLYDNDSDGFGDPPSDGQEVEMIVESFVWTMPWDITGFSRWVPDGKCDIRDIAIVATCFGSFEGDGKYDIRADITGATYLVEDGKIDIKDVALVASHFGFSI